MKTLIELQESAERETLQGFFDGIPNEIYHDPDCPGVSKSGLDKVHKSYAHYKYYLESKGEQTKAMMFGSAIHDAILEPDEFSNGYIVQPKIDRRTKEGKEKYSTFCKNSHGKGILTNDEMTMLLMIVQRFNSHPTCKSLLANSICEHSAWYNNEGILCKFRPDIYRPGEFIADIKTTQDASLVEFRRAMVKYNYDKQAAFYHDGVLELTGESLPFYFIAIEKNPPYEIAIYQASTDTIETGRELYKADLKKLSNAIVFGDECSYPEGIQSIDLPSYGHDLFNR